MSEKHLTKDVPPLDQWTWHTAYISAQNYKQTDVKLYSEYAPNQKLKSEQEEERRQKHAMQ